MAGRFMVTSLFGAVGFAIGFLAFLASPGIAKALSEWIPQILLDQGIVFATITGAAGAMISTAVVTAWARRP